MQRTKNEPKSEAGFSLIELIIAMGVTLVIMGLATTLLMESFNVRAREDRRSDALADAQRALNLISRELANSGYALDRLLPAHRRYTKPDGTTANIPGNGLIPEDSDATSIKFAANLNAYDGGYDGLGGPDEVLTYQLIEDGTNRILARRSLNPNATRVLVARTDGSDLDINFAYLNAVGNPAANLALATTIQISITVELPAVGAPGVNGYQPARQVQLESRVELRNAILNNY
ncbi:MAG: prepilin-type N-terminal cleavage/methylation domain-containing protein [Acidobacteriota bacterium]|nr:prepilin-type N-terminal cleavage/methylation domain-containing protein [Acidobacteriota bacterium]